MSLLACRARTLYGLARGMLTRRTALRGTWADRVAALDGARLVSTDIFNTLLIQAPDLDERVLRAVEREVPELLRRHGLECPYSPDRLHRALRSVVVRSRAASGPAGHPSDAPRYACYLTLFREAGFGADAERLGEELLSFELALHGALTRLDPEVHAFLKLAVQRGVRVIALTDMYLREKDLRPLLRRHGVEEVGSIYSSSDLGRSKFHGSLFAHVLDAEGVDASAVLHIGDSVVSDVWSARRHGIRAIRFRSQPAAPSATDLEVPAFRVGYQSLGPALASFGHLLLAEARAHGLRRLAFVARDGDLLREVMSRLVASVPELPGPVLDYVCFSRRSTALPLARGLGEDGLRLVADLRAPGPVLLQLLAYFDVKPELLPGDLALEAARERPDVAAFLADPRLARIVDEQTALQTALLAEYLRDTSLFGAADAALVDVGWRATIQAALNATFRADPGYRPLRGFYLGLWSESGSLYDLGAPALGLLGDARRRPRLLESAPWQLAFVLEAICRASHGTVTGYRREASGRVEAVLADQAPGLAAERARQEEWSRVRAGVLAAVDDYARRQALSQDPPRGARRRAQLRMLRLAFFPRKEELTVLSDFVRTEGHAERWHTPLVAPDRPSPFTSPRRWVAGLASPWRAGYVAATGGPVLSAAFLLGEAVLVSFPGLRRRLQAWARRWAGI